MEEIYLNKRLNNEEILKTISEIFTEVQVFHDDFTENSPEKLNIDNPAHIFFNTDDGFGSKEFNFRISIYRTPKVHEKERELYLAKIFSEQYRIKTLVPFSNPDDPGDPFYDIVFDDGKIYLADDSKVDDSTGGDVEILHEYHLEMFDFDKKAEIIKFQTI